MIQLKNLMLTVLGLVSLVGTSLAQNSLSGTILDENKEGIFFATIALYAESDSSIVQTASSDELGQFNLSNVKDGLYFLKTTMLGYIPYTKENISFPIVNQENLEIVMLTDANLLETVEIKSRRPLLEQYADKLVVNVAENITSLNSNLLDVMKKVPGVIVAGDKVRLAGSNNLTILINGKTTKYMDVESLMKDMPGDNIQKVEIIHQPGAEFDASGTGPIINIILKKNSLFGTTGSVNMGYSRATYDRFKAGLNLSHYQGPLNVNMGLGFRDATYESGLVINRLVKGDAYVQTSTETEANKSYRGNLSLDWDVNDRHRIGFQSRFTNYKANERKINLTSINFKNDQLADLKIQTDNVGDSFWKLRSINPYYTFNIDTSGQKFELDFNYITFWNESTNVLSPFNVDNGDRYTNQKYGQPGKTSIYVGKLDYSYPINKALNLKLGSKYSFADLDNDLRSHYERDEEWLNNPSESNHFLFDEQIVAAYSKLAYKKDAWAGTLGLRYENSLSNGKSVGVDTTLTRAISQLFPSASLSRDIIKGLTGIFAYSYRLDRPQYSSLNPFRYSLDSYTSQRGNPDLKAEFTHSMKFSLAYENQPFFNVEYKRTKDAMVDVLEQDDDSGEAFKSIANLANKTGLNINLAMPLDPIPHLSGYVYIAANHTLYDAPYLNSTFDKAKWDYLVATSISFTLPWDINTELSGWYTTGGLDGLLDSEWMYGTSIGFSKRFFSEKLKLSFGVDNPFNRFYYGSVDYSNIDVTINQTWDAPRFNVQVHYKFGNQHFKDKQKHRSGASEELNRANKN